MTTKTESTKTEERPEETGSLYLHGPYGQHVMGCAELAFAVCDRFGVHGDDARQACFATIVIDTKDRFIFESPAQKDEKAAGKADDQIKDVPRHPTPEQAEDGALKALRDGVKKGCRLLNAAGYTPPLRPATIDDYIKKETQLSVPFEKMDSEDLEALVKNLAFKLDELKKQTKTKEDDAGF